MFEGNSVFRKAKSALQNKALSGTPFTHGK
jgi:hypothetical protein